MEPVQFAIRQLTQKAPPLTTITKPAKSEEFYVSPVTGRWDCLETPRRQWQERSRTCLKEDITDNGTQEATKKPEVVDQAEVAHEIRKAFDARAKGHWGALSAIQGYQSAFGQRVCRHYEKEASGHQERQTTLCTA